MTTEHWIVAGLVAVAVWLHRARLLGNAVATAPAPPPTVTVRHVEAAPAPAPAQAAIPSTAQLLSLVHHQTEADALQRAHETAAAAIVEAKAQSKALGLPWTVLAPAAPAPPPGPPAPAVPNG